MKVKRQALCDTFYSWSPGADRPVDIHIGSKCHNDDAKSRVANRSHTKALCVFAIFGATLAYSVYFQYTQADVIATAVATSLAVSYVVFLAAISLTLASQLLPDSSRIHTFSRHGATLMGACGCVLLCLAMFWDIFEERSPELGVLVFFISVLLAVSIPWILVFLKRRSRYRIISKARSRSRQGTALSGGTRSQLAQSPSPHVAIAIQSSVAHPDVNGGQDDHAAAFFFLVAYYFYGGALAYLRTKFPVFCEASLEERATMLLSLYDSLAPDSAWHVSGSTDDVQTLCRRFLELENRWGSVVQEMHSLVPQSVPKGWNLGYRPSEVHVERLLMFEKFVLAARSRPAPETGPGGEVLSHASATRPGEEVSEGDAAAPAPSTGNLYPARLPVSPASASSDSGPSASSSPHAPEDCANGTSELPGGNLNHGNAASEHMPRADAGAEIASSCDPLRSGVDVGSRVQVSAHPLGPEIAVAAPSAVKGDDLAASLAPVIPAQPVQADANSTRGV